MKYKEEEVWYPLAFDIWHWDKDCHDLMLNDKIRMESYEKAIKEMVKPGMKVLDLGTGTGILALWSLEAGAEKVYGIEFRKELISQAKSRINKAGYEKNFQLFNALSYDVNLPEKVDLIVSEILGNLADNQDMTPILEDARKRFLKKDGKFIPYRVETFLVPIDSMKIYNQVKEGIYKNMNSNYNLKELMDRFNVKNKFDLPFNSIIPQSTYLSAPENMIEFNFKGKDKAEYITKNVFTIMKDGIFTGFKGYFIAYLSPTSILDISPGEIKSGKTSDCWKNLYLPIEKPFKVKKGDKLYLDYERFYPTDHKMDFVQGYSWSGRIERKGEIVYKFSQSLGNK